MGNTMKCPFRKKTKTLYETYGGVVIKSETEETFADCIEKDCPFYGVEETRHRRTGGYENVTLPICRRTNND